MIVHFPLSKQVRVIDTDSLPADMLELIIRRGILEMAKDPSTKAVIQTYSYRQKPVAKSKPSIVAIG